MGRSKNPRKNFTGEEHITRLPMQPNIPAPPRKGGDIGVGGGPGIPPRFPREKRRRQRGSRPDVQLGRVRQPDGSTLITYGSRPQKREPDFMSGPVTAPGFPSDGPSIMPIPRSPKNPRRRRGGRGRPVGRRMPPRPRPPIDDLGPPPEREVPIPKERLPRITRESDPRGSAPFAPDERGMAKDRFFERMFDRAEEAKQKKSMQKEERREVREARNEERRARRSQPGEINVGNERREIRRSMMEERARRRMEPGEIDVGGEIDINAERGGRRRRVGMRRNRRGRRRDFTSRRSRMMGGRRGRSMEERAAFRDRYVSSLRGGFFS